MPPVLSVHPSPASQQGSTGLGKWIEPGYVVISMTRPRSALSWTVLLAPEGAWAQPLELGSAEAGGLLGHVQMHQADR